MRLTRRQFSAMLSAASLTSMAGAARSAAARTSDEVTSKLPKTFAGKTLRVLIGTGPAWDPVRAMSSKFSAATGVGVEFTALSYNETYQKLILDLTGGSAAFDGYAFAYQWKHEIAPFLADLSKVDGEVAGAPALRLDDYPGKVLETYGKVGDKLIGLPLLGDVTLFVWNKDAYTKAGLDPKVAPASWDEVAARGKSLEGGKQYGFGLPAGKSPQTANIWILLLYAFGGQYFDAANKPVFNSAAGRKAMHFLVEQLQPIAPPGNLTWDFPEMLTGLTTGASAQSMMWPGGFGALLNPNTSQTAKSVAWCPTPGASLLGGWAFGVNAASPSLDAAKLYSAWLTSPEIALDYALNGGSPARASVLTSPDYVAIAPQAAAVLAGLQGNTTQFPPVKESEQVVIMIYDEVNAAAAKVKTPDQAVDDLQAKVEAFMRTRAN